VAYGYWNKILSVNLTDRSHRVETLDEGFMRKYLGGRGLGLTYLFGRTPPGIDPLSPENPIIFATGALTGAAGPSIPRFVVVSKSPLTGGLGASEAGGFWGPELKFAGYDALVVEGKADRPVYLSIADDRVEVRDAAAVWGKEGREAQDIIRDEIGDPRARVLLVGPAGERLVRFACISNDLSHYNGRNGLGAVMGAKNLKAVAVRGTKKIPLADEATLREIARRFAATFKDTPQGLTLFEYGTTVTVDSLVGFGALPSKNWETGADERGKDLFCNRYNEEILVGRHGCFACPIRCKRTVKTGRGDSSARSPYGGPEFETIAALGSNCGVYDLSVVACANEYADRLGMDTISLGMTVAFAMRCFTEGILTTDDTGGIDLSFGNGEALLSIIERIATREGIGDVLAEGSVRAAREIGKGSERFLVSVKGQEVPMHDPRIKTGVGISYAVSDIGADHMVALHDPFFSDEGSPAFIGSKLLGIERPAGLFDMTPTKAKNHAIAARYWRMQDSLGCCHFGFMPRGPMEIEELVRMVNAVTGWDIGIGELLTAGERAITLSRIYNRREGFSRVDDRLPEKYHEAMAGGPYQGKIGVDREGFEKLLALYYEELGWDPDDAFPTPETIRRLGLVSFAGG
jgi:aldehyde:ferredoxin oxidoreductase